MSNNAFSLEKKEKLWESHRAHRTYILWKEKKVSRRELHFNLFTLRRFIEVVEEREREKFEYLADTYKVAVLASWLRKKWKRREKKNVLKITTECLNIFHLCCCCCSPFCGVYEKSASTTQIDFHPFIARSAIEIHSTTSLMKGENVWGRLLIMMRGWKNTHPQSSFTQLINKTGEN